MWTSFGTLPTEQRLRTERPSLSLLKPAASVYDPVVLSLMVAGELPVPYYYSQLSAASHRLPASGRSSSPALQLGGVANECISDHPRGSAHFGLKNRRK